jgi:hypothetical protein
VLTLGARPRFGAYRQKRPIESVENDPMADLPMHFFAYRIAER